MTNPTSPPPVIPRVDLMPRSEIARRERDNLVRLWVWAALGAVVVALLIIAAAFAVRFLADQRLAGEQARTSDLLEEISSLSDVSQALNTKTELTEFRSEAMATDLAWTPVITAITGILPPGTALVGYDLTVGAAADDGDPATATGLAGTVAVDSATSLDIAAIIRALRGVPGVRFADGRSVTSSPGADGRYTYLLDVAFDQTIYSHEYDLEEGSG